MIFERKRFLLGFAIGIKTASYHIIERSLPLAGALGYGQGIWDYCQKWETEIDL